MLHLNLACLWVKRSMRNTVLSCRRYCWIFLVTLLSVSPSHLFKTCLRKFRTSTFNFMLVIYEFWGELYPIYYVYILDQRYWKATVYGLFLCFRMTTYWSCRTQIKHYIFILKWSNRVTWNKIKNKFNKSNYPLKQFSLLSLMCRCVLMLYWTTVRIIQTHVNV